MKQWAEYARKSQDREDRQVASIPSQLEEIKKIKERNHLKVVASFVEEKSAKYPGRPEFNKMIQLAEKGDIQGVICWDINRLSRNAKDSGTLQWLMDSEGLEIMTPTQTYNYDNSSTAFKNDSGRAEQYSKDLSKVVKRGNRTNFRNGKWLGPAPLGYINERDRITGESMVLKDPERFDLMRKAWDYLLSGQYSPSEIHVLANEEWGLTLRATRKLKTRKLYLSTLMKIFRNPFYYGLMEREVDGQKMRVFGNHVPMLTKQEFEKAQQILGAPKKPRKPEEISLGLNGSLIKCSGCGYSITFEKHKKVYKNGNTHIFVYGRCSKKGPKCTQKYIPIEKLNQQIEDTLAKIAMHDEFFDWALETLQSQNAEEEHERESVRDNYEKRLKETHQRLNRLLEVYLDDPNIMTRDEYMAKKQELEDQESRLQEQLQGIQYRMRHWFEEVEERLEFARTCAEAYRNGSAKVRRNIVARIGGSNLKLEFGELDFVPVNEYKSIYKNSDFIQSVNFGSP